MELAYKRKSVDLDDEYIVFKVTENCNLWPFVLLATQYNSKGERIGRGKNAFIFPRQIVSAGDYVVIHTNKGENKSFTNKAKTITHSFYWGLDYNVWDKDSKAVILKIDIFQSIEL